MIITTTTDGVAAAITPRGEITFDALPGLLAAYHRLPPCITRVTWNFQQAMFMDIAGLHLLVHQRHACRQTGRNLMITGLHHQPLRLLQLAQELFPSEYWSDFLSPDQPATAA